MAANSLALSASYSKYSDERQLIDDDNGWLEDDEFDEFDNENDGDGANISVKHIHFVTEASLSSWKNQDATISDTNYGYIYIMLFIFS